ncbi:MAG: phosphoribosylanthranilate isomerase [Alphaproteobacteria bacterium]|nr:phosphoribosylanthranilate isomerase [Alphaproteobacteria bacterium]
MSIAVKICGLKTRQTLEAAVAAGADFVGFNFYSPSPRFLSFEAASELAGGTPQSVRRVGVFVDASDETLERAIKAASLDLLQLHGEEPPERVSALKARFGLPIIKALAIAVPTDVDRAQAYASLADWLLFDAKPPLAPGALPGGNAARFEWSLLAGRQWSLPWIISGGLDAGNVAEAIAATGAAAIDVSSGVERERGVKDVGMIGAFIAAARASG